MYIPRYPTLWPSNFIPEKFSSLPFPLDQDRIAFYNLGRTALYHAVKTLHLSPGDEVLIPSYICSGAVTPFIEHGLKVVYYAIDKCLSIDKADLEKKVQGKAKALLVVNYFGFPQDIDYLKTLKKTYSLSLIEDCAHNFLSDYNGIILGSIGDVSIFTLRKSIPVHNVGLLYSKHHNIITADVRPKLDKSVYAGLSGRAVDNFKFRSGITFKAKNMDIIEGRNMTGDPCTHTYNKKAGLSFANKILLRNLNYEIIKFKRRRNFYTLLQLIKDIKKAIPVFDSLPEGICPLAFPLIVENRDQVCRSMNMEGIDCYPWPFLPNNLNEHFGDTWYLANNIMLLPIHQDLDEQHIKVIAESLARNLSPANKR